MMRFLKLPALVTALALAGMAAAQTDDGSDGMRELTIGYVNWTEANAVSHLMQAILEKQFGYQVELRLAGVEEVFEGVAKGEMDAFLDVWLPTTHHDYWQTYQDEVVDLGVWYEGEATLGIGVPDYVEARDIGDLKEHIDDYHGEITGIEKGSGIMRLTEQRVIPTYGLESYKLVSMSTPAMIDAVDEAIRKHEPIAFTAWKPHWMFTAYPIRYLDDPHHTLGHVEQLHAIARQGLREEEPVAYALLDAFSLTEEDLGSLELAIEDARSAHAGVRNWLKDNRDVVAPWINAASRGRRAGMY